MELLNDDKCKTGTEQHSLTGAVINQQKHKLERMGEGACGRRGVLSPKQHVGLLHQPLHSAQSEALLLTQLCRWFR